MYIGKFISIISILYCLFPMEIMAQETIPAAGGTFSGTNGSLSFTLGQVFDSFINGSSGSIQEGIQQVFSIHAVTGFEHPEIELLCSVYPNPTQGNLSLRIDRLESGEMSYALYDLFGNILDTKKLELNETGISIDAYASEIYFLKVVKGEREVKVFKIIKY